MFANPVVNLLFYVHFLHALAAWLLGTKVDTRSLHLHPLVSRWNSQTKTLKIQHRWPRLEPAAIREPGRAGPGALTLRRLGLPRRPLDRAARDDVRRSRVLGARGRVAARSRQHISGI